MSIPNVKATGNLTCNYITIIAKFVGVWLESNMLAMAIGVH